jgi:hypothetical protein
LAFAVWPDLAYARRGATVAAVLFVRAKVLLTFVPREALVAFALAVSITLPIKHVLARSIAPVMTIVLVAARFDSVLAFVASETFLAFALAVAIALPITLPRASSLAPTIAVIFVTAQR